MDADKIKELEEGVQLSWNFQLADAIKLFSKHSATDPVYAWLLGSVHFLTALVTETNEDAKKAFETLTAAHKKAKSSLSSATKGSDVSTLYKMILADTNLLDAALKFKLQRHVKGVYKFRKAWVWFASAEKDLQSVPDSSPIKHHLTSSIYAGVGFFHFIVSIVPKAFRWLVEGIGFKGDREKGLSELTLAANANGFGSPMALLHLIWINAFFVENQEEAEKWLQTTLSQFPTSAQFHYLAGYVHRKFGSIDMAECSFLNTQVFAKDVPLMQRYADYEIAYSSWLNLEWDKARAALEPFLAENPPDAFKVYGTFQLAVCYDNLGNSKAALEKMKSLGAWVRKDYDYDAYAGNMAKKYISAKGKFDPFQKQFQNAQLRYEAWAFKDCQDILLNMGPDVKTENQKALHTWLRGACCQQLGEKDQAVACYEQVARLSSKVTRDGRQALPNSYTGLAEILIEQKKYAEAEKYLNKAKAIENYEFSQLLSWKIKRMLDSVKKAKKTGK